MTRRCSIYFNYNCNVKCKFCYFLNTVNSPPPEKPIEKVKEELKKAKEYYGLEWLDISGGEPTLYKHIIDALEYSKSIGLKLCLITNGVYTKKIRELVDLGIDDILLSIEGIGELHNNMVGVDVYSKVHQTMNMLRDKEYIFRTNTVVTNVNCNGLFKLADKLISEYNVKQINLIPFNPHSGVQWTNTDNVIFQGKYSDYIRDIKMVIELADLHGVWVNVRYLPLCLAKGFEGHVCNFKQNVYDPYDWVGFFEWGYTKEKIQQLSDTVDDEVYGELGSYERACNMAMKNLTNRNVRLDRCRDCINYYICDGLYSQYIRNFGDKEFQPITGGNVWKIRNPNVYRMDDRRWET